MEKRLLQFLNEEIKSLEYLILRLNKEDIIIKHLCQSIIQKFDILDFDTFKEQSDVAIQLLHDFNMIHEEHQLKIVNKERFNYWQSIDGYNDFKKQ